jgi:hypothetical protein
MRHLIFDVYRSILATALESALATTALFLALHLM